MKHKFFATGFVLAICIVVFLVFNARPVSMNLRFQGTAYEQDAEIESGITIQLEGNLHNKVLQKDKFTGYATITSKNYPNEFDAVSLQFNKHGIATCDLTTDGNTFGTLTIDKKFEYLSIQITDSTFDVNKTPILAAPATNISQAKEIIQKLNALQ